MLEDERLLASVVDHLPLGVWIARAPKGEFVFANRVFREIMGIEARPDVAAGQYAEPYAIHDESGALYAENRMPFARALEARETVTVDDIVIHRSDGRRVNVRATARPVKSDDGTITHVVVAFADITLEKEAERLKRAVRERRESAQRLEALGTLAAGVAHDFNNILASIQMLASRIRLAGSKDSTALEGRIADELRQIERAVETAAPLTRSLLTFGRVHGGGTVRFEVDAVVRGVVDFVSRTFDRNIEIDVKTSGYAFMRGDPSQIEQLVLNLVINARDAMPEGGKLFIGVRTINAGETEVPFASGGSTRRHPSDGAYVLIEVADTGAGVPEAIRSRIFEPYFTTKESNERRGTGLGLATVYGIVEAAGGTVDVGDAVPHGARFSVRLPVDAARATASAAPMASREVVRGSGRILLVDDEPLVREAIRRALVICGYEVLEASDGVEAVAVYRASHAELSAVVLDAVMPKLGGLDAFASMMAISTRVPVILMSGRLAKEDGEDLMAMGVRRLLPKPFGAPELSRALADVIGAGNITAG